MRMAQDQGTATLVTAMPSSGYNAFGNVPRTQRNGFPTHRVLTFRREAHNSPGSGLTYFCHPSRGPVNDKNAGGFDTLPIINPRIGISLHESCYGEPCARSFIDGEGNLAPLPGHLHIHVYDPEGGSRTFGVAACDDDEWQLPGEVYGQFD